jgi:LPXTG-site transpeptidase (sortase) family protein
MVFDSGPGDKGSGGSSWFSPSRLFPKGQPPYKIIGAVVVVVAVGVLLGVVAGGSGGGGNNEPRSDSGGLVDEELPTPEATIDLNVPDVTGVGHLSAIGEGDRLSISKIGLNAPITYRKVELNSAGKAPMPDPSTPDEIAYYDFSAVPGLGGAPGKGGNTLISGHVDSGSKPCNNGTVPAPCRAIFWDVRNLRVGDEIELSVSGQTFRYRVTANESVHAVTGDWDSIVASTPEETLTMITCGGSFVAGEYTHRTVVRAVRLV